MRASSVTVAVAKRGTSPIVADVGELDQWKHCPSCGAEVEPAGGVVDCGECGFRVYASSKPTASGVCLDDEGRILLSRRGIDPFAGKWDLPGGFLDEDEHPRDCVRRELREEAGVEIEPLELLGVWMDQYGPSSGSAAYTLNFYWTARIVEGTPEPHDDVAEFRWFALDEIVDDDLAFPHTREVLALLRHEHA
jgi:ADP-ribose pyrophosphatase YjhB (NUDIX family)